MRSFFGYISLAFLTLVSPVSSQEIVLGLSKDKIGITALFDGSDILIFGAVKHGETLGKDTPLEVAITVASPLAPVTVRRKEKRLGIWVNVDSVTVDLAPNFYAVATTGPFSEVVSKVEDLRYKISVPQMIRLVSAPVDVDDPTVFAEAVSRIRENLGLYQTLPNAVVLQDDTLFSSSVRLPANLVEGEYKARIFLTRSGKVIASHQTSIDVRKVGIGRWLYNLAHEHPVYYGLMSLAIAIFAGWAAAAVFRLVRGG
ncbi:MAG: TIGR02186 family protein, partial [Planktomarina sp.]|nr:TIGR02186 family protein [Planktomarina sp.]